MDQNFSNRTPDWHKLLEQLEAEEQSSNSLSTDEKLLLVELRTLRDEAAEALESYAFTDTNQKWAELSAQIAPETARRSKPKLSQIWVGAAAAAVLVVLGIGLIYNNKQQQGAPQLANTYKNDIAPGQNAATLTLANGNKISLSAVNAGQLLSEAGIIISKTADGEVIYTTTSNQIANSMPIHTLSTSKGETYRLRLPDQSEVWLNASSSIKFPASFAAAKLREVELVGEAYFEIAKDKARPFIVKTERQQVQVLGTHFNVNSYADEKQTVTTLVEGSVRVSNQAQQTKTIRPGEQAIVQEGKELRVAPADLKDVMAWKNGYFRFRNESIEAVMSKISRWYDIEVVYAGKGSGELFHGNISLHKNISEVLNMLSYSNDVKFKVEGRRVTVIQ